MKRDGALPTLVKRLRQLEGRVLEHTRQAQPTRGVYFPDWSIREETRFTELWTSRTLSNTEAAKLYSLLAEGEVVKVQKDGSHIPVGWNTDYALIVVFHKFIQGCPTLRIPCLVELMKVYTRGTVARLLSKYGWRIGFADCSTIRPLDEWTREDRDTMIDLISPDAPPDAFC